jgi:hypothetical protein
MSATARVWVWLRDSQVRLTLTEGEPVEWTCGDRCETWTLEDGAVVNESWIAGQHAKWRAALIDLARPTASNLTGLPGWQRVRTAY